MLNSLSNFFSNFFSNFNWSAGSLDWYVALIFAISVLIHFFALAREKYLSFYLGILAGYILILFFPYNAWLKNVSLANLEQGKEIGFLVLSFVFTAIFIKSRVFNISSESTLTKFFKKIIFGILNTGLLLSLLATLLPISFLHNFSPFCLDILNTDITRFIWLIAPVIILSFSSVKIKRPGPGRPALE